MRQRKAKPERTNMGDLAAVYRPRREMHTPDFSLELSLGYQVRSTHRALQRYLQTKIEPHGVTLGMWYFLRVLWQQDGVTQRDLSRHIGTMEPTTLNAIASMERSGLVRRKRDVVDRRRVLVYLTAKGHALRNELLPLANTAVRDAAESLSLREISMLLELLKEVQANLCAKLEAHAVPGK